jgi:hypothetical protein
MVSSYPLISREFDIESFDAKEQSDGSYVDRNGTIIWYNEAGDWHRVDGPAISYTNGDMEWVLNDINHTFTDWLTLVKISDEAKMLLRLQYG